MVSFAKFLFWQPIAYLENASVPHNLY